MNILKKLLCLCLSLILLVCFCACEGAESDSSDMSSDTSEGTSQEGNSSVSGDNEASNETSNDDSSDSSTSDESEDDDASDDTSSAETSQDPNAPEDAEGGVKNPMMMLIGSNTVSLNGSKEYYYKWTADENAVLTLQFSGASKTGWSYDVKNLTAGDVFDKKGSSSKGSDADIFLTVFKGDEISVAVNTANGSAGSVTVKADLLEEWGTETNPIPITVGITNHLRVPAGKTIYFSGRTQNTTMVVKGASNSVLTFDGVSHQLNNGSISIAMPKSEGGRAEALSFALANNNGTSQVYDITCNFPVGTTENPAKLNLGSNSIQISAGNQYGYVFEWTATAKGQATITITCDNWHYEMLNINTMGQEQGTSKDKDSLKEATVKVTKAGQVIRITINSGDGKAANVTFNFSFE